MTEHRPVGDVLERLKDRKVVQWTVAYLAAAWVVLQVADILADQFSWPVGVQRAVTVALAVGSLVTAVLAWFHGEHGHQRVSGAELLLIAALLAGGAVALRALGTNDAPPAAEVPRDAGRPGIAVLPFEHRGEGDEGAYFTDGIHDEILTRLSSISALSVISRTSVMAYRGTDKPIREIAEELGVAYVVEGAVQRVGGQVRVIAQLIDAVRDDHLWADSFDRPLSLHNLLAIQAEVATQVAGALRARLTADERARIRELPTDDLQAYQYYLEAGGHRIRKTEKTEAERAVELYELAVTEDPDFATAWADLAYMRLWLYWSWAGYRPELARARRALDRAVALAPDASRTLWAQGYFAYYGALDYDAALRYFDAALVAENGMGVAAKAVLLRRMGRWEESLGAFRQALRQEPRQPNLTSSLGQTLALLRRYDEAIPYFDRVLAREPTFEGTRWLQFQTKLAARGDSSGMAELVDELGTRRVRRWAAYVRRDYPRALAERPPALMDGFWNYWKPMAGLLLEPGIREAYADSLRELGEAHVRASTTGWGPEDVLLASVGRMALGYSAALSGRPERAVAHGRRAAELVPVTRDAIWGARLRLGLVNIYAMVGDHEAALDELEYLLSIPSPVSTVTVRLDPLYDEVRADPRCAARGLAFCTDPPVPRG